MQAWGFHKLARIRSTFCFVSCRNFDFVPFRLQSLLPWRRPVQERDRRKVRRLLWYIRFCCFSKGGCYYTHFTTTLLAVDSNPFLPASPRCFLRPRTCFLHIRPSEHSGHPRIFSPKGGRNMAGDEPVGRTRSHHNRYFSEVAQTHSREVWEGKASPLPLYMKQPTCRRCFGEGHQSSKCPYAGIYCNSCGGEGHDTDDCPLYFMELSIRGHLTAHIQKRSQQAEQEPKKLHNKGRFPSQNPEGLKSSSGSTGSESTSTDKSARRLTFSAVQCIVCGCMGHANCISPTVQQGVCHCPCCSHPGHTAAECPRYNRDQQQLTSDNTYNRKLPSWGMGTNRIKSSNPYKTKWHRQRETAVARAAAADPWHPLHL